MEIQLGASESIHAYGVDDFVEIPNQPVYGVSRRPEDPPIKQLLSWGYAESPTKARRAASAGPVHQPAKISEHQDEFRGYYYSTANDKYYKVRGANDEVGDENGEF
jgi:hypothetical protein